MSDLHWFALYVQPSAERAVTDELNSLGLECFFPFTSEWVNTSQRDRSKLVRRAYFPRYVFVRVRHADLHAARDIHGVCYVVSMGGASSEVLTIPDLVMAHMMRVATPTGEILIGKAKKKRFRKGELLKITEEGSPLLGMLLTFVSGSAIISAELVEKGLKVSVPLEYVERDQPVEE